MPRLNAAQLQGARNRLTLSPELLRRTATLLGYDNIDAEDSLSHKFDVNDAVELLLMIQLTEMETNPPSFRRQEKDLATMILGRVTTGNIHTRQEIHELLPPETVVLLRMGHPRLWGYAVAQRLPDNAHIALPASFYRDQTGPYTTPEEAWMGVHITEADNLEQLNTHSPSVPVNEDRYQRLRLGMSLADDFRQVWSSARGHWAVSPDTAYIVPSRYGWCPYIYRVTEWREDSFGDGQRSRYTATRGYYIDPNKSFGIGLGEPDPNNCWLPTITSTSVELTDRDVQVAAAVHDKVIALGPTQKNPVIRLRQKGRRLF
ncbi:hypothetical protein ACFPVT_03940 [Corynebacterium choanae]|uniref:Uncharacterized protein n=1 Tax=Corynebacterium choanae TaxID=1862358 RepID=A0A3G6J8V6_9CORY|nr:hypothetical protein [Corynebacterium choanae]AZA14339.1 hypothetical protein CCHOA_09780 [Corynebacterium choanae]